MAGHSTGYENAAGNGAESAMMAIETKLETCPARHAARGEAEER
jgi:hypothetical protein